MDKQRVTVGVGSYVELTFNQPHTYVVSLSGVQEKVEACYSFAGKITSGRQLNSVIPGTNKLDVEFCVTDHFGRTVVTTKSNIKFCVERVD